MSRLRDKVIGKTNGKMKVKSVISMKFYGREIRKASGDTFRKRN